MVIIHNKWTWRWNIMNGLHSILGIGKKRREPLYRGRQNENFPELFIPLSKNRHLHLCQKTYSNLRVKDSFWKVFLTNPQVINLRFRGFMIGSPTQHRVMGSSRSTCQTRGLMQAQNFFYPSRRSNLEIMCHKCPYAILSNKHHECSCTT
jgi:hypothetical protein